MLRLFARLALVLLLTGLATGCPGGTRPTRRLVVVGASGMVPLLEEIAARFHQGRDDVRLDIAPSDSERTIKDTRLGLADIGLLASAPGPLEGDLLGTTIALDGVALILHPASTVRVLDDARLARLLAREVIDWEELGGTGQAPCVLAQGRGSRCREVVAERFGLRPDQVRIDTFLPTAEQVVEEVCRKPTALGMLSLSVAEKAGEARGVRVLPCGGVAATRENLRAGRYLLVRHLTLLTRQRHDARLAEFLSFATSPAVHDLILAHGYQPVVHPE